MSKQEIKFKPAIVNTYEEFKLDINKLIDILSKCNSEWFLYCLSYDHNDMQFLTITYDELYNNDDYKLYKQNASTNNFSIGVINFTESSEHNYSTLYNLLGQLKHKSNDFANGRR